MFTAVSILGLVLAVVAGFDRRTHPLLMVIALVWMGTAYADTFIPDRVTALAARIPIDFFGGLMSLMLVRHGYDLSHRWAKIVPVAYTLLLLCHATYWLAYYNGVSLWAVFAHSLNALFILQLAALAVPGGGKLIDRASSLRMGLRRSYVRAMARMRPDDLARSRSVTEEDRAKR